MATRVVLDTNVLVANFRASHALTLLFEGARTHQLELIVPELVIREAATKFREMAEKRLRELEKARASFQQLGIEFDLSEKPEPVAAATRYEVSLRKRLKEIGAVTPPIPEAHHRLVHKALH